MCINNGKKILLVLELRGVNLKTKNAKGGGRGGEFSSLPLPLPSISQPSLSSIASAGTMLGYWYLPVPVG
jgi:hypothetical protein